MNTRTDDSMELVLDFLQRGRDLGLELRVRDMEPILPTMGIPLGGDDHFILLMSDTAHQIDLGRIADWRELSQEYPGWVGRIEGCQWIGKRIRELGPELHARMHGHKQAPA